MSRAASKQRDWLSTSRSPLSWSSGWLTVLSSNAAAPSAESVAAPTTSANTVGVQNVPADYVIGPDDILSIVYWRDKDMTGDVTVRPDGKISLPLLNEVQAAGLTPPQLRDRLTDESKRYIEDPNITVVVRQINSRKVYIPGEVVKPLTVKSTRMASEELHGRAARTRVERAWTP